MIPSLALTLDLHRPLFWDVARQLAIIILMMDKVNRASPLDRWPQMILKRPFWFWKLNQHLWVFSLSVCNSSWADILCQLSFWVKLCVVISNKDDNTGFTCQISSQIFILTWESFIPVKPEPGNYTKIARGRKTKWHRWCRDHRNSSIWQDSSMLTCNL